MRKISRSMALVLLTAVATKAQSQYEFSVDRSQPCTSGCTDDITVQGTITVNTLGELTENNFTDWSLTTSSSNYPTVLLDTTNSKVTIVNGKSNAVVFATECALTITLPGHTANSTALFAIKDSRSYPYYVQWLFQGGNGDIPSEVLSSSPRYNITAPFDQTVMELGDEDSTLPTTITLPGTAPSCNSPLIGATFNR